MAEGSPNLLPLLNKIAIENNIANYDIKITPLSTGGANFSSILYLANISGDGSDNLRLFIKTAAMGEKFREQTDMKPYEFERFVYTNLKKVYGQMEERCGLLEERRMKFPKYYGSDDTDLQEILVLEDLASQGYVLHDRMKPVSREYAIAAITELAKFHALSIRYEHENPQEFREIAYRFRNLVFNDEKGNHSFYNTAVKTALNNVREENKDNLKTFLDAHNIGTFTRYYVDTRRRCVLLHGDYRPSNMLRRSRHDGAVDLIVVDYQTIIYGTPVMDLLYFIFLATDGPSRDKYYHKLVQHYHAELGRALASLGLDVEQEYSAKDFQLELQEKLPYGLLVSVLVLPIVTVDEKEAPKLDSELNLADMSNLRTGAAYQSRLNQVVDQYVGWGILSCG